MFALVFLLIFLLFMAAVVATPFMLHSEGRLHGRILFLWRVGSLLLIGLVLLLFAAAVAGNHSDLAGAFCVLAFLGLGAHVLIWRMRQRRQAAPGEARPAASAPVRSRHILGKVLVFGALVLLGLVILSLFGAL